MKEVSKSQSLKPNGVGVSRILKAFSCSIQGFKLAYIYESAFRQELLICAILFPLSFVISSGLFNWLGLVISLLFLLFAEVVNSAIEALADRISTEHHVLIGRAKDLGSAAVLIAFVVLLLIWFSSAYIYFSK